MAVITIKVRNEVVPLKMAAVCVGTVIFVGKSYKLCGLFAAKWKQSWNDSNVVGPNLPLPVKLYPYHRGVKTTFG